LAEIASIVVATASACAGSATFTTYQCTVPAPKALFSSKYFQWNSSSCSRPASCSFLAWKMPLTSNVQVLLPEAFDGKMVDCSGILSPTFQPYFFASAAPTMAPVRVRSHAARWSAGSTISGYSST